MTHTSDESELRDVDDSPSEETFQIVSTETGGKKANYQQRNLQELRKRT